MKKFLLIALLFGCKQTQQQKEAALKDSIAPIVKTYFTYFFDGLKVDTIQIVEIDTLTPKKLDTLKAIEYNSLLSDCKAKADEIVKQFTPYQRMLDIEYSKYAANNLKDLQDQGSLLLDSMYMYDSLSRISLQKSKNADSTTFLNYLVKVNVKVSTNDMVQKELTDLAVIITKDFKVKERHDYVIDEIKTYSNDLANKASDTSATMIADPNYKP